MKDNLKKLLLILVVLILIAFIVWAFCYSPIAGAALTIVILACLYSIGLAIEILISKHND